MDFPHLHIVIMAGGAGVRFWPASTQAKPKQFLDILGCGETLLQATYRRARHFCPPTQIWVVTNAEYAATVLEQLPELQSANVVGEPAKRNTGPCLMLASALVERIDPLAEMLVLPSDHHIGNEGAFYQSVEEGVEYALTREVLLTFGVRPHRAETGYGYIEVERDARRDFLPVERFHEKPDAATAKRYVGQGNFFWNSGMFAWQNRVFRESMARWQPALAEKFAPLEEGYSRGVVEQIYGAIEPVSIDYALLELAGNVEVLPVDFAWSDLGTWQSVYEYLPKDALGNATQGSAVLLGASNCLVSAPEGQLIVLRGLENYAVIQNGKSTLICPISESEEMRKITAILGEKGYDDHL